jgi:hypothetical protein
MLRRHATVPQVGPANPNYKGGTKSNRWYVDRFRAKYPEKAAAHDAVKNAVQAGRLVKPSTCQRCGKPFEKRLLHSHHHDYSKPLEVVFACRDCHRALDEDRRNSERHLGNRAASPRVSS